MVLERRLELVALGELAAAVAQVLIALDPCFHVLLLGSYVYFDFRFVLFIHDIRELHGLQFGRRRDVHQRVAAVGIAVEVRIVVVGERVTLSRVTLVDQRDRRAEEACVTLRVAYLCRHAVGNVEERPCQFGRVGAQCEVLAPVTGGLR